MPRKKIIEEEKEEQFEWDKPRIIIFFVVVVGLIIGGFLFKHFFLDAQNVPSQVTFQSVHGTSTSTNDTSSQPPTLQNLKQTAQDEISSLQKQAEQISIKDIASSSPQVQQVLQQLQNLPNLPGDVAKQTCEQLCGKL